MILSWSESASIRHTHTQTPAHTHTHTTERGWDREPMNRDSTPPLGAPLGAPSRSYLLIVIINKGVIQYVPGRNPTSLLRTVTLPVHQVLESSSPPPRVQNTIYRIGGFPIYESRRGRNRSRRIKTRRTVTGLIILETGNGPINLGASLLHTDWSGMFLVESHTFWPTT